MANTRVGVIDVLWTSDLDHGETASLVTHEAGEIDQLDSPRVRLPRGGCDGVALQRPRARRRAGDPGTAPMCTRPHDAARGLVARPGDVADHDDVPDRARECLPLLDVATHLGCELVLSRTRAHVPVADDLRLEDGRDLRVPGGRPGTARFALDALAQLGLGQEPGRLRLPDRRPLVIDRPCQRLAACSDVDRRAPVRRVAVADQGDRANGLAAAGAERARVHAGRSASPAHTERWA